MKIFYVYIIQCVDESLYVGVTSNIEERIREHNNGKFYNSYTITRRPVELKWFEEFTDPDSAFKVEKQIKGWSRKKKISLIEQNWDNLIKYSKNYTDFRNKDDE